MTENKIDWAKEPWRIEDIWVMSADEDRLHPILTCGLDHYVDRDCVPRIVACVNACAGVPTEVLKQTSYLQLTTEFNVRSMAVLDAIHILAKIHDDPDVPTLRLNSTGSLEEEWSLFGFEERPDAE